MTVLWGCTNADEPAMPLAAPSELNAEAVGTTAVRVSWRPSDATDVAAYALERRKDLTGEFEVLEPNVPAAGAGRLVFFDTKVDANTYYGYRAVAVSALGERSAPSNVGGTKTPPPAGLRIRTTTTFPNAASADPDGYTAVVRGPDTLTIALALNGEKTVSPLRGGAYSVTLRGLAKNCATAVAADTLKQTTVTTEGTNTVSDASFLVSCRDPSKASIVVVWQQAGDTLDPDGLTLAVTGLIREPNTPESERVYAQSQTLSAKAGAVRFDNLRPGDYEVALGDVDPPCRLDGDRKITLVPRPLSVDTVRFALTCRKPVVIDTVGKPFILRQRWSTPTARPGDRVSLLATLDLRAQPAQAVRGVSATFVYDQPVVRFDSARSTGTFDLVTVNGKNAPLVAFAATNTSDQNATGDIQIVRLWFTVVGALGSTTSTSTSVTEVLAPDLANIARKVRVEEGVLAVTTTPGPTNQIPTAAVTAPAVAEVGTAISFSGSGSSDPDGSIASYAWNFGDGGTVTGVSATHTYTLAGTYTVRLTVTDDRGATATAQRPILVTGTAPTTGTVAGTVSSPQRGALNAVTVNGAGGFTTVTNPQGKFTLEDVPPGSRTLTVSNLPAGCTAPGAQTVSVTAGGTTTADITVTCVTQPGQTGALRGTITRATGGAPVAGAQVIVTPAGGAALPPATTDATGAYTVPNIPIGTGGAAGNGTITIASVPSGCTTPSSASYSGLAAGGTVTKDFALTCEGVPTTGTLTGIVSRNGGDAIAGVTITATPAGGTARPGVTSDASGRYAVVDLATGDGTIVLTGLPNGCTDPGPLSYSGVTAGGTVTKNITVTCAPAGAFSYAFSATWGPITNTGPTGKQATLSFMIDMGDAPGRPDVAGSAADPLSAISFGVNFDGTKLAYQSRSALSPDEFDIATVGPTGAGTAGARANVAVASSSGTTKTGVVQLIRITFNIVSGQSGTVTPTVEVTEALATTVLVNITSTVAARPIPPLTIP